MTPEEIEAQKTVRKVTANLQGGALHPHLGASSGGVTLLPASADKCQECAVDHAVDQPHNAQSIHYQYDFYGRHGRWPTWVDAMAHCDDDTKAFWTHALTEMGKQVEYIDGDGNTVAMQVISGGVLVSHFGQVNIEGLKQKPG